MRLRSKFQHTGSCLTAIVLFASSSIALRAQAPVKVWKATELWRTDGGESGEPFSDLRDFVVLKDNSLWALDFKAQDIRRYGADGKLLGKIARKGNGPGEISNANGMLVTGDGSVWVNDPQNSRFSVFNPDGKFSHQYVETMGGWGFRWMSWFNRTNGEIVEQRLGSDANDWRRFNRAGKELGVVPHTNCSSGEKPVAIYHAKSKTGSMGGSYPFARGGGLAPDGTGNVWCATPASTRVVLIGAGKNDTVATANLDYPMLAVASAERDDVIKLVESQLAKYSTNDFDRSKIPSTKPGISALYVDEDGRLWVRQESPFGKRVSTLDVFDAKGKHQGRVVVPHNQNSYLPMRARGNLLWVTILDDDDVPYIVHYRLQP